MFIFALFVVIFFQILILYLLWLMYRLEKKKLTTGQTGANNTPQKNKKVKKGAKFFMPVPEEDILIKQKIKKNDQLGVDTRLEDVL